MAVKWTPEIDRFIFDKTIEGWSQSRIAMEMAGFGWELSQGSVSRRQKVLNLEGFLSQHNRGHRHSWTVDEYRLAVSLKKRGATNKQISEALFAEGYRRTQSVVYSMLRRLEDEGPPRYLRVALGLAKRPEIPEFYADPEPPPPAPEPPPPADDLVARPKLERRPHHCSSPGCRKTRLRPYDYCYDHRPVRANPRAEMREVADTAFAGAWSGA